MQIFLSLLQNVGVFNVVLLKGELFFYYFMFWCGLFNICNTVVLVGSATNVMFNAKEFFATAELKSGNKIFVTVTFS